MTTTTARKVAEVLANAEGCTFDVRANAPKTSGGTCVAVKGYEKVVAEADVEAEAEAFVEAHADLFAAGKYLGLWKHEGRVYFDVVEVLPREEAVRVGRERGEIAVYDLDASEEIVLGA